jgi:hypothetical protein
MELGSEILAFSLATIGLALVPDMRKISKTTENYCGNLKDCRILWLTSHSFLCRNLRNCGNLTSSNQSDSTVNKRVKKVESNLAFF